MKSGYDQFFKKAKENRGRVASPELEAHLRQAFAMPESKTTKSKGRVKANSKSSFPVLAALGGVVLLLGGLCFFWQADNIESFANRVEVQFFGQAVAQAPTAKSDSSNPKEAAKAAVTEDQEGDPAKAGEKSWSEEDINHFSKLSERKKELDGREQELVELEEELQKQKVELEKRIKELQEVRDQIAALLKDRVEVDQAKVDRLVEFYSNMKPKQAAEIIATINEDLAVEILGRMKKKNAAEIMNLLVPAKAQTLSEKYAGYRRR